MRKRTKLALTVCALIALTLGHLIAAAAASGPPAPEPWRPAAAGSCYKSTLERHVERRSYTLSGHRFVLVRRVATVLRWCPPHSYEVVVWHGVWGPPRR